MNQSRECPQCHQHTLSPWEPGLLTRRCTLCGFQEDNPQRLAALVTERPDEFHDPEPEE